MVEYIEREALINSFRSCGASKDLIDSIVHRINLQEAADVVPVRHGKWEKYDDDYYDLRVIKCSLCNEDWCFEVDDDVKALNYNYCPNCGAKMDGRID